MNVDDRNRAICNIIHSYENTMPELINGLNSGRKNKFRRGSVLSSVSRYHKAIGIRSYFIDNDVSGFKQNYFLSSRLALASAGEPGGEAFETGGFIMVALLSDSEDVIQKVAHIETPEIVRHRNDPLSNFSHVYMLQLAIRGDDDQISMMVDKIARNGRKPLRTECAEKRDFYSLLLKRDKSGLEALIQSRDASLKSADPIDEEFISYFGALETKLCWRRGIQVEIDHPLVPMGLMPVKPLDHYDDVYDFLKPGWMPPPQGLIGRVSRWFKT